MVSHGSDASRDGNGPPPVTLARLLTELAALPPEQRAAIAALLTPALVGGVCAPPIAIASGREERGREPDRLHAGYEEGLC